MQANLANGTRSQFAGALGTRSTLRTPEGMAFDPAGNRVFVAESRTNLEQVNLTTGVRTLFMDPTSGSGAAYGRLEDFVLAPGGGALYVVDDLNNQVLRIALSNTARTVVSSGTVGSGDPMPSPNMITVEAATGDLYAARGSNVVRIDPATGARTQVMSITDPGWFSCGEASMQYEPMRGVLVLVCGDQASVLIVDPQTRQTVISTR